MDVVDRIELLLKLQSLKKKDLPDKTGIPQSRWQRVFNRSVKTRHEDVEAVSSLFPQYEYWLFTGKELPAAGQVSPLTEKIQTTG